MEQPRIYTRPEPKRDGGIFFANAAGYNVRIGKFLLVERRLSDYYILYMVSGSMKLNIGGAEYTVLPGAAVLYHPADRVRYYSETEGRACYYFIHFGGTEAPGLLEGCRLPKGVSEVGLDDGIILLFRRLLAEFALKDELFEASSAALAGDIIISIARRLSDESKKTSKPMSASLDYIHINYMQQVKIEKLAELEHISASRFYKLFHDAVGSSPGDYIINLRINRACELLSGTGLSVAEVARFAGYSDPLYFSRIFKKKTTVSPMVYRNRHISASTVI